MWFGSAGENVSLFRLNLESLGLSDWTLCDILKKASEKTYLEEVQHLPLVSFCLPICSSNFSVHYLGKSSEWYMKYFGCLAVRLRARFQSTVMWNLLSKCFCLLDKRYWAGEGRGSLKRQTYVNVNGWFWVCCVHSYWKWWLKQCLIRSLMRKTLAHKRVSLALRKRLTAHFHHEDGTVYEQISQWTLTPSDQSVFSLSGTQH